MAKRKDMEPGRACAVAHSLRVAERRMGRGRKLLEHVATVPHVRLQGHAPHARVVRMRRAWGDGQGC